MLMYTWFVRIHGSRSEMSVTLWEDNNLQMAQFLDIMHCFVYYDCTWFLMICITFQAIIIMMNWLMGTIDINRNNLANRYVTEYMDL